MLKNVLTRRLALAIALAVPIALRAQSPPVCGWSAGEIPEIAVQAAGAPAFDVEQVLSNCLPVFIRVNLHFFTETTCSGPLHVCQRSQTEAYALAENLIGEANAALANNGVQWHMPGATAVCNPLRYVLAGVYIHCTGKVIGGFNTPNLHAQFAVHPDTEINVYVADFPAIAGLGDPTGIGYATYASIDWLEKGNLNHEIGHVFNLLHSFDAFDDGCADTPIIVHNWDKNCDGDTNDPEESKRQCWTGLSGGKQAGESGYNDDNHNGVHDCSEVAPCTENPCCDWSNVDNNVMSYNAFKSAYTACQLRRMLNDLATNDFACIAAIGACPPPHAFIAQTPADRWNPGWCGGCLMLEASVNDSQYLLELYEQINGQDVLVYNSGWEKGPVHNFCFTTRLLSWENYLRANCPHKAVLSVRNDCGDTDTAVYPFSTPPSNCAIESGPNASDTALRISPNPAGSSAVLEFEGHPNESFLLLAASQLTGGHTVLLPHYSAAEGLNRVGISLDGISPGSYTLLLAGNRHLYYGHLVKW